MSIMDLSLSASKEQITSKSIIKIEQIHMDLLDILFNLR